MNKPTKKEQIDEAWEAYIAILDPAWIAYEAIKDPAWIAYKAKVKAINAQLEEPEEIITQNGRKYKLIKDKQL